MNSIFHLCLSALLALLTLGAVFSEQVVASSSSESVRLRSLQEQQKSSYQFQSYRFQKSLDLQHRSKSHFSSSTLSATLYPTRSFVGIQSASMEGQPFLDCAAYSGLRNATSLGKKVFPTTSFPTDLARTRTGLVATTTYPTKTFHSDETLPSALEHDLQQALQKAKSVEEVRDILEKEW